MTAPIEHRGQVRRRVERLGSVSILGRAERVLLTEFRHGAITPRELLPVPARVVY